MTDTSPPSRPLLVARDLCLTLPAASGAVNILCGVDLDLSAGETVALLGPSGSGKTSLLMLLAGLEQPSAGSLLVEGRELARLDEEARAAWRRGRVGIVFQGFHLIETMTALENVAIPLELAGRRDASGTAAAMLGRVGLAHRAGHLPGQLSGGEQQRVALARALAPRPALVLADEPTGNLDQATGAAVMDLLFALVAETGAALLLITHDPALAAACGRQVRMADGRIAG